ncbi:MAG: signal peptidase I [Magnetococcales bacterium]|nr:signal peptidase I [Magnetococcales bacterium]
MVNLLELSRKKHLWHGILFVIVSIFVFGNAVSMGIFSMEGISHSWGVVVAIALLLFGLFLLFAGKGFLENGGVVAEYYEAIVMAVGIAFMVRTFVVEPFKIPSGSMIPTLLVGDYLFVNKFAYGYRIPFTQQRIFMSGSPARGEIAVFEYPKDPTKDYIKRIVGLPGDRILYRDRVLYVNGQQVSQKPEGPYSYLNENEMQVEAQRLQESLGSNAYSILLRQYGNLEPITDIVIPAGYFFVLGDNRDNSNDSRFWGLVPGYRLVGRAVAMFWSWDRNEGKPRWERLGQAIK